jgi:hypothetical protein
MTISRQGCGSTAGRALQETLLNKVRLNHILNGVALFAYAGRNVV